MPADDLQCIALFLARRDVPSLAPVELGRTFEVLVLCGSAVLAAVEVAARAVRDGVVDRVLVTGGVGHSTPYLVDAVRRHRVYGDVPTDARPEARILADVLQRHLGVPPSAILIEEHATNCGENAELSLRLLGHPPQNRPSVLLVQDPTMQRRTHASFDHHQRDSPAPLEVVSHAPFVPVVGVDVADEPDDPAEQGRASWSLARFTSLALGEIRRLRDDAHGYGPRGAGYIGHVDVPADVLAAYERLVARTPADLRER